MQWWKNLFNSNQSKASSTRAYISVGFGQSQGMNRNFEDFAREGYQKNIIAFRSISMVALAASQIPLYVKQGDKELESHPLIDLLKRPNPMQSINTLIEYAIAYKLLTGNSYIEAVAPLPTRPPLELWTVRPDHMHVIPGPGGVPKKYIYKTNVFEKDFPVDPVRASSDILHVKTFNPLNEWLGMSPIEAAVHSVDIFNEQGRHNYSLMRRGAVPSGIMKVLSSPSNPSGTLTDEQFDKLKAEIDAKYSGGENAGRPMLLEGGVEWQQLGLSPRDMDWVNSKNTTAKDIANAFGVPPILVNIAEGSTFANMSEARLSLYEDTVIPMMKMFVKELNNWLVPRFDKSLSIEINEDGVPAISDKRRSTYSTLNASNFLTVNEKREAVGYGPIEGGDVIVSNYGVRDPRMLDDIEPASDEPQDEPEENDDDKSMNLTEDEKDNVFEIEHKFFNLVTGNEKRRAWQIQNMKRRALQIGFQDDLFTLLTKQANAIEKALQNVSDPRLLELSSLEAIHKYDTQLESLFKRQYKRAFGAFGDQVIEQAKSIGVARETKSAQSKYNEAKERFVVVHTAEHVSLIQGTTESKVRSKIKRIILDGIDEGINNQQIAKELRNELTGLGKTRARTIARTEVAMVSVNSEIEAVKALDVPGMQKEWISIQDDRGRDDASIADHRSMNGARVGMHDKFHVDADSEMDGPLDPSAGAHQNVNCRCMCVFTRGE